MIDEATDMSIVVWCPNPKLRVPDTREWTNLCLLYDQVIVWSLFHPIEENKTLAKRIAFKSLSKSKWTPRIIFNDMLIRLSEEGIVQLLTIMDVYKYKLPKSVLDRIVALKAQKNILLPTGETFGMITSYAASKHYGCPIITNDVDFQNLDNQLKSPNALSQILENSAICQFALPDVKAVHVDDLLEARTELKDELLEFRAGIVKLTWLLHQQVRDKSDLEQIRFEADTLANTVIKGSLLSLENRIRQHKKKAIRRILFGTGRVLVEATKIFLPSGAAEKMISGGKGLFQMATELDSTKPPEDQIATYLYKLKGKFQKKH